MQFDRTDMGNAELIAHLFGKQLRFDWDQKRWLVWEKHYWDEPKGGRLISFPVLAAKTRLVEAGEDKAEIKFAIDSRNISRINNALELAKTVYPIDGSTTVWNHYPYLLASTNGVVDLRTAQLRPGEFSDYITLHSPVTYDSNAKCPRWDQFLREIFYGDMDVINFVQKAAGYSITGETKEQVLFICVGTGANGKGKFVNTIHRILGNYSHTLPLNAMDAKNHSPFELAGLVDRRIASASEMGEKLSLDSGRIKALTGEDLFTARNLYQSYFTFTPVAKFWLSTNNLPEIKDYSHGFWRRILTIMFEREFKGEERDNDLETKLMEESEGILRWLVEGAKKWYEEGLNPPAKIMQSVFEYREENDVISSFIHARCIIGNEHAVKARELFNDYLLWSQQEQHATPLTETAFGLRVKNLYIKKRLEQGVVYRGLSLRPDRTLVLTL